MQQLKKTRKNYQFKSQKFVWLQLSAGQGPKECGKLVAKLAKRILQDAAKHAITAELVEGLAYEKSKRDQSLITIDAYLSCLIRLSGIDVENYAQSWQGVIKWHAESPYRPKYKRCNWFAAVELVPVSEGYEIDLKQLKAEVDIETMRSSGAGGQHVNKTSSAVRLSHRPTGIQVRVETDRSQHRNRQLALERLQLILAQGVTAQQSHEVRNRWLKHYQVERGNPTRVFHGTEFKEKP